MRPVPRILSAGDRAVVVEYGDRIDEAVNAHVHRVARALDRRRPDGLIEIVPTYRSVMIHFDPLVTDRAAVAAAVTSIDAACEAGTETLQPGPAANRSRLVEIPVVYGGEYGPDLADVAAHCGLAEGEVVAVHAAGRYRVYMMGFTPGFPYLGGMSPRIATPRLPTPRTRVPAGSVGIAAQQTGVYPTASPGGWRLIGRSPVHLFDPLADPPCAVDAGDVIRFVPITSARFQELASPLVPPPAIVATSDGLDVLDGGMLTTVQDTGRPGFQRYGVPVAGAMDVVALRAANRLVGNADDAAGLEMTLVGPSLRFDWDGVIALTGADMGARLNERSVRPWRSQRVKRGDVLTLGSACRDIRGYLAVSGGLAVPPVLRSRSTFLASGFGGFEGRALRRGDRLPVATGDSGPIRYRRAVGGVRAERTSAERVVRVLVGPQADAFTERGLQVFLSASYLISSSTDRVGCRLTGPRIEHRSGADIVSDATVFGAVQVSGDGMPIVLMADRGTTGGYTKIATVIAADLALIAQAGVGDRVRFLAVDHEAARAASVTTETWLQSLTEDADRAQACDAGIFDEDAGAEDAADGADALAAVLRGGVSGAPVDVPGVRAGMTGLVVEVCIDHGAVVAERQTLLVIEAMKMQNPVRAPRAGRVARVFVAAGAQVAANTVVVEYED